MTYLELQQRIAGIAHRSDLTAVIPNFIEDTRLALNRRFSIQLEPLVNDDDTNEVLTDYPDLYILGSMRSLNEYINDGSNAQYYDARFATIAGLQNITGDSASTDNYHEEPPQIKVI